MKYKYNEQWVDINIKALDSMPIGTQVDFSGSTIPSGWEEVNDYSTSEIDTGKKWVNGKKIYRKAYATGNLANAGRTTIALGIIYDTIISLTGYVTNGTNTFPLPFPSESSLNAVIKPFVEGTNIYIDTGSDRSAYSGYVWIEYTKSN